MKCKNCKYDNEYAEANCGTKYLCYKCKLWGENLINSNYQSIEHPDLAVPEFISIENIVFPKIVSIWKEKDAIHIYNSLFKIISYINLGETFYLTRPNFRTLTITNNVGPAVIIEEIYSTNQDWDLVENFKNGCYKFIKI